MFQPKPNSKCGAVAGGVNVSLHPSPRPGGLCHSHFCTNRNWYHVESPTTGTRTQSSTLTHTMKYTVSAATWPLLFHVFMSVAGLHGRKHHVESGWPVDHAAEGPFRTAGTREGDAC